MQDLMNQMEELTVVITQSLRSERVHPESLLTLLDVSSELAFYVSEIVEQKVAPPFQVYEPSSLREALSILENRLAQLHHRVAQYQKAS